MNKQKTATGRGIEWTDFTWNPIAGCRHGCAWTMPDGVMANCYAEDVADGVASAAYPHGFEHHYWRPETLDEPLKVKTPSRIFVGSMADVFGAWVPDDQIRAILDVCAQAYWHDFQFVTKNAPRLLKFEYPPNVWTGVSVPPSVMFGKLLSRKQQTAMLARTLAVLANVKSAVRWMSIEPLSWDIAPEMEQADLDWVVIGAASSGKKYYPPEEEWVENLVWTLGNIRKFFKGNLKSCGWAADHWYEEFPEVRLQQTRMF